MPTQANAETESAISAPRSFRTFAWAILALNILVILWGAYVRASGSGAGCGNHWPMCNGEVIPNTAQTSTWVEFAHRATSGIDLLAVVGLVIWAFRAFPKGHEIRRGAVLCLVFILTEALLGAALVKLEHVAKDLSLARGYWMSMHLANTFTLLAVLAMTAHGRVRRPSSISLLAVLMTLGISGAIAALGDTLFPSANWTQDFASSAHLFVRLRVLHPAIAVLAAVYTGYVVLKAPRILGFALLVAFLGQIMLGIVNLTLLAPTWMQMVHLLAADTVWILAVLYTVSPNDPAPASG